MKIVLKGSYDSTREVWSTELKKLFRMKDKIGVLIYIKASLHKSAYILISKFFCFNIIEFCLTKFCLSLF